MGGEIAVKTRSGSSKICYAMGIRDGMAWLRQQTGRPSSSSARRAAQQKWSHAARKMFGGTPSWSGLLRHGKRYAAGFQKGSRKAIRLLPIPLRGTTAAVLYAPRRIETLRRVFRQLRKLPLTQTVVIMHDASPAYFAAARAEPGVLIAHLPDLPDPDVGRALGAKLTTADSVLFVDGERPVKAAKLARFLWAADTKLDAALNDVSAQLGLFHQRTNIFRLSEFLNTSLNRPDLRANSMTMLPFALSRRALNKLGPAMLASPAKAHTAAILSGLRVGTGGNVAARQRTHSPDEGARWRTTTEHHAEAWRHALSAKGNRLVFPDRLRNRKVLEEWEI